MSQTCDNHGSGDPLPLSELKRWMSDDVYSWVEDGDKKEEELKKEMEENPTYNLFGVEESDSDTENANGRVKFWSSSSRHPDGVGGFDATTKDDTNSIDDKVENNEEEEDSVSIVYMFSESYKGSTGETLWSSARHIANVLANPSQCRDILAPMLSRREDKTNEKYSPIFNTSFLEVGAGAGVPSWTAMKCGARVICTDLSDPSRIRTLAECAERNFHQMEKTGEILNASKTRVCPHDWGSSVDDVAKALNSNGQELFDVIVAADCCYLPWLHSELLDSIDKLLSAVGVALIVFALHDNTDDEDVWKIVDRARDKGFSVEILKPQQLAPPKQTMDSKQGLVHRVRLTRP